MAGDVNVVAEEAFEALQGVRGTRRKGAGIEQKSFSEYHLYTLPRPTTVAHAQTKQIELMAVEQIPVTKSYFYRSGFGNRVAVRLEFENSQATSEALGIPLPQGPVRLYLIGDDGQPELLGTDQLGHTPKDELVRLQAGFAFDVTAERQLQANRVRAGVKWNEQDVALTFRNHKQHAVQLHVEESLVRNRNWRLRDVSHPYKQQNANTITFELELPANGQIAVTYTVEYTW
jgi:hypothetical protein